MSVSEKIVADFVANGIEFVTTVPCKQLGGVIDAVEYIANLPYSLE